MTVRPPAGRPAAGARGADHGAKPGADLPVGADALSPVRAALVGEAVQQAEKIRAAASAEAEAVVAAARGQAEEILSQARVRGELDGRSAAASRRAMSRRAARGVVLAAQRDAYSELRRRVHEAVCALREDPVYPRLRDRLEGLARGLAGPSATVACHPAGGVVAEGPGTFVDCSLPRLADRAVDALGAEVTGLWSG
jgi:hypothetical protein